MVPQHLQSQAITIGLMGLRPSSATFSIGVGWAGGCCLRCAPHNL